jgi:hypothetical protein
MRLLIMLKGTCTYLEEPGPQNTQHVIDAVIERLAQPEPACEAVVVGSTSGLTAVKFARAITTAKVVCVSEPPSYAEVEGKWPTLQDRYGQELKRLKAEIVNTAPYVFHSYLSSEEVQSQAPERTLREFLISAFGNGFKVAVESILMATSVGAVKPYKPVIGVGGFHRGADTAIVARTTFPNRLLSPDPEKSFNLMEIIAIPRTKSADPRRRLA